MHNSNAQSLHSRECECALKCTHNLMLSALRLTPNICGTISGMANWKGHIAGGIAVTGCYVAAVSLLPVGRFAEAAGLLQDWQALAAVFVIGILFALFPDVDTNSKAQDLFFGIVFPLNILLIVTGNLQAAAYLGLIAMLPIVGHHRGWTHKKWAMFVVPLPILFVPYLYNNELLLPAVVFYSAAVVGYFSHLLFDGLIVPWIRVRHGARD